MVAFWAASVHCWDMLNFLSINIPKTFSFGLLPISAQPVCAWDCPNPSVGPCAWTLHLLNFMRSAWAHLSNLSMSLWMASLPCSMLTHADTCWQSLVSAANLLRVPSITLSMTLTKMLISAGPSDGPWGMPFITGLPLAIEMFTTALSLPSSSQFHWVIHPSNICLSNLETGHPVGQG